MDVLVDHHSLSIVLEREVPVSMDSVQENVIVHKDFVLAIAQAVRKDFGLVIVQAVRMDLLEELEIDLFGKDLRVLVIYPVVVPDCALDVLVVLFHMDLTTDLLVEVEVRNHNCLHLPLKLLLCFDMDRYRMDSSRHKDLSRKDWDCSSCRIHWLHRGCYCSFSRC